jgi:uncharacterized DUF497 family protein
LRLERTKRDTEDTEKAQRTTEGSVGRAFTRCADSIGYPSIANQKKHGVSFEFAQDAFFDPKRIIALDLDHSTPDETRFYCFGKIGDGVLTVRFTTRKGITRIFGAGYWRKGKKEYEKAN